MLNNVQYISLCDDFMHPSSSKPSLRAIIFEILLN